MRQFPNAPRFLEGTPTTNWQGEDGKTTCVIELHCYPIPTYKTFSFRAHAQLAFILHIRSWDGSWQSCSGYSRDGL
ncbi:hypothetical protein VFPPC_15927 [Pochonia chlamydosporia 170]|uniref:Uncharacterized protein n=1 Tax=Pochonia chlamydosporia 170 TaxID=1380566 RepID=A0A179FVQ3_METCM|nr:hypothetical protein VFPPC_15927 [Pochonia chlamydosporia 170]OAQ69201.2 hypothetical protein VFPPC_15927 [Pochonia chlamydosporia 170]